MKNKIKLSLLTLSLLLVVSGMFTACQPTTPQEKAEKAVTDYLKLHTNSPSDYESVSFTKLDKENTVWEKSAEYVKLEAEKSGIKSNEKFASKTDEQQSPTNNNYLGQNLTFISQAELEARLRFRPQFVGYVISHAYKDKKVRF